MPACGGFLYEKMESVEAASWLSAVLPIHCMLARQEGEQTKPPIRGHKLCVTRGFLAVKRIGRPVHLRVFIPETSNTAQSLQFKRSIRTTKGFHTNIFYRSRRRKPPFCSFWKTPSSSYLAATALALSTLSAP